MKNKFEYKLQNSKKVLVKILSFSLFLLTFLIIYVLIFDDLINSFVNLIVLLFLIIFTYTQYYFYKKSAGFSISIELKDRYILKEFDNGKLIKSVEFSKLIKLKRETDFIFLSDVRKGILVIVGKDLKGSIFKYTPTFNIDLNKFITEFKKIFPEIEIDNTFVQDVPIWKQKENFGKISIKRAILLFILIFCLIIWPVLIWMYTYIY